MLGAHDKRNTSFKPLVWGFVLSLILLSAAYLSVVKHSFDSSTLMYVVMGLAFIQMLVQIVLFLHVGMEPHPRWNLMAFLFLLLIVGIVVTGSLWIMKSLDYMMPMMNH